MRVSIIVAMAQNRVIGRDNKLPWHIPEDFKWFKKHTQGHTVVMGRKTFESMGRILPDRRNIILSRKEGFSVPGAFVYGSLEEALQDCAGNGEDEAFVIGGGRLFRESLPYVDRLYLTLIHRDVEGDAFFPELPEGEFEKVFEESHRETSRKNDHESDRKNDRVSDHSELPYTFFILDRTSHPRRL